MDTGTEDGEGRSTMTNGQSVGRDTVQGQMDKVSEGQRTEVEDGQSMRTKGQSWRWTSDKG